MMAAAAPALRTAAGLLFAATVSVAAAATDVPRGLDLYMPVPDDNPLTAENIDRGRRLFNDPRLSRDGTVTCASCHDPQQAFSDGRPVALGVFRRTGTRNTPAIINRGYGRSFFWNGRAGTLEEQVLQPIQDPNEMDMTLADVSARVGFTPDQISRSLASYVRSILSGNSRFDRYVDGDRAALSPAEVAGLQIFRGKARCTACHVGPTFSDEQFHNTGVAWRAEAIVDDGRFAVTGKERDRGAFKTPTLREIARTAPYMHDGSKATLEEVVNFYNDGGRANPNLDPEIQPLKLTVEEKRALVAFLKSLSGEIREGLVR
jgi:cytochrome c peroxidase